MPCSSRSARRAAATSRRRGSTAIRAAHRPTRRRDAGAVRRRRRPALVEGTLGRGRVLVLGDDPRSRLERPRAQAGLPAVRAPAGAAGLRLSRSSPAGSTVGQAVDCGDARRPPSVISRPAGQRVTPPAGSSAHGGGRSRASTKCAMPAKGSRCAWSRRNVDLTESDLARVDPGEVSVAVTGQPGSERILNGGRRGRPRHRPGAGTTNLVVPAVRRYPDPDRRIVAGAPAVPPVQRVDGKAGRERARYGRLRARRTRCRHPAGAQAVAHQAGDSRRGRLPRRRRAGHLRDRRGPRLLPLLARRHLLVPHSSPACCSWAPRSGSSPVR